MAKVLFKLVDTGFGLALVLSSGIKRSVFLEVTVGGRELDGLDDVAAVSLEVAELTLKHRLAFHGHGDIGLRGLGRGYGALRCTGNLDVGSKAVAGIALLFQVSKELFEGHEAPVDVTTSTDDTLGVVSYSRRSEGFDGSFEPNSPSETVELLMRVRIYV